MNEKSMLELSISADENLRSSIESANFARIRGSIERQRGRAARNENLFRAGASLLRAYEDDK